MTGRAGMLQMLSVTSDGNTTFNASDRLESTTHPATTRASGRCGKRRSAGMMLGRLFCSV
jgi:hypothetical protein